jgi:molybdopterin molybdotransferase
MSPEIPSLRDAIADQLIRADLIVVTGDPEAGDDRLRATVEALGPADFAHVAMVPGGAQTFSLVGEEAVPLVVIPFEPVAAHVTIETMIVPMLRQLIGTDQVYPETRSVIIDQTVTVSPDMVTFAPAIIDDHHATISGKMGGADGMVTLYAANALLVLESDTGRIESGSKITCLPLER